MVSLRFPFSSFPPPGNSNIRRPSIYPTKVAFAAGVACAVAAGGTAIYKTSDRHPIVETTLDFILSHLPLNSNSSSTSPFWASLSLSSDTTPIVESKTGASFPPVLKDSQTLLGLGLRKKSIFGIKNIDVYAFGVYADEDGVKKKLKEKYANFPASDLKGNANFNEDLLESDIDLTVRLQIVYSKLSIRSVRTAFEDSVGSRLQKFGGEDNKELLQRFTSQFKDDVKIPKGSVIELSREHDYVLRTKIDGKEVGNIQSKLLCRSVLDLYIGEDPFDQKAKENVMLNLAKVIEEKNAPTGRRQSYQLTNNCIPLF